MFPQALCLQGLQIATASEAALYLDLPVASCWAWAANEICPKSHLLNLREVSLHVQDYLAAGGRRVAMNKSSNADAL